MRMGLGLGLNFQAGAPPPAPVYDTDAQAYFDAVVAAGGAALDATHKSAFNTFVVSAKAASLWTKFERCHWLANQHATAAKVCLKSLGTTQVPAGTITFTADRGYAGNGSNGYLNTNFILAGSIDSSHLALYNRTNRVSADTVSDMGAYDDTRMWSIACSYINNTYMRNFDVGGNVGFAATAQGFWVNNRSGGAATQHYRNGVALPSLTQISLGALAIPIFIGAMDHSGVAEEFTTDQYAFWCGGSSLSAGDVTNLNTIVEACADALGAGVQ